MRFIADLHHFSSPHPMDSGAALIRSPSFTGGGRASQFACIAFSVTSDGDDQRMAKAERRMAFGKVQIIKAA